MVFGRHVYRVFGSYISDQDGLSDQGVAGSSLTGGTALCPLASHFILCLVLVQPRKTHLNMTEIM